MQITPQSVGSYENFADAPRHQAKRTSLPVSFLEQAFKCDKKKRKKEGE